MLKVTLFFVAAAVLAGCATHEERVAAIEAELPQLVTACNGAFRDGSSVGLRVVTTSQGIEACDRLAFAGSLDQVRPATADLYQHYRDAKTLCLAGRATETAMFPNSSPGKTC